MALIFPPYLDSIANKADFALAENVASSGSLRPSDEELILPQEQPESSVAQSYQPLSLPSQQDFEDVKKAADNANLLIDLNQAFSIVPASITGRQLPESLLASQRASAQEPLDRVRKQPREAIEGVTADLEIQMNDPKSSISEFARENAFTLAKKLNPALDDRFKKKIENLSAAQLEKLGLNFRGFSSGGSAPGAQQSGYINAKTGNPVYFDTATKTYKDALDQSIVTSGNLINRNVTMTVDPETGDKLGMGIGGKVQTRISSVVKPKEEVDLEKEFKGPNSQQRKFLDEQTNKFTKITETATKQLNSARNLKQVLKADTKLELGAVRTQMARLSGEVGNLAAQEQEIWSGSQALLDRANQYIASLKEGRLTPENRNEILKAINAFQLAAEKALLRNKSEVINRLKLQNIPESYSTKYLPSMGVEERLRVKDLKTGQILQIPASKSKKYIDDKTNYEILGD
jgi:hypothetical protein